METKRQKEQRMYDIEKRVNQMEEQISDIQSDVKDLNERLSVLENWYDEYLEGQRSLLENFI